MLLPSMRVSNHYVGDSDIVSTMSHYDEGRSLDLEFLEFNHMSDQFDSAIERLEGIRDAIMTYGISKPMMYAVDPKCELVDAGIVASYEELEDVPVKDDDADAAVEGIGDAIKKFFKMIADFFKSIWDWMVKWTKWLFNGFKHKDQELAKDQERLSKWMFGATKFDESARVETREKCQELDNAVTVSTKALDDLIKMADELLTTAEEARIKEIGAAFDEAAKQLENEVTEKLLTANNEPVTLKEAGFKSVVDVKQNVAESRGMIKKMATKQHSLKQLENLMADAGKKASQNASSPLSEEVARFERKKAVLGKKVLAKATSTAKNSAKLVNMHARTSSAVSRAITNSHKKKVSR